MTQEAARQCPKCEGYGAIEGKYCDCSVGQMAIRDAKHVAVAYNHETGKKEVFVDSKHAPRKVEAGDRALETARKIADPMNGCWHTPDDGHPDLLVMPIAALIQSAMNAQRDEISAEYQQELFHDGALEAMNADSLAAAVMKHFDHCRCDQQIKKLPPCLYCQAKASLRGESAMNAQERELRELREALRDVLEWERDYRTRNHLGKTPPHPFVQAERLLAERGGKQ